MMLRRPVLFLLFVSVLAPIVLYTDRLGSFTDSFAKNEFIEDASSLSFGGEISKLNALPQESSNVIKEPVRIVYSDENSASDSLFSSDILTAKSSGEIRDSTEELPLEKSRDHITRVLSAANENENLIEQVTGTVGEEDGSDSVQKSKSVEEKEIEEGSEVSEKEEKPKLSVEKKEIEEGTAVSEKEDKPRLSGQNPDDLFEKNKSNQESGQTYEKVDSEEPSWNNETRQIENTVQPPDATVRSLRDQLIRAKVYLGFGATRGNPRFMRELRGRIREVQRVLGDATKDSELPKGAFEKLKSMQQTLAKGKQIQDDCVAVIKKLRAILHSTEEQLRIHKKQTVFLTQLAAKTLPKGLHCLPLRLSTEYYSLDSGQQQFPNQDKLQDPKLYHYALFSDNILAAAVVVNSTVFHAKEPAKHVFHIVTDRLNYAAMRMWFLANPPGKATIQVQSIDEFTWLNSSYSPVLKQLGSQSMIDYYFRTHHASSDSNLKFRNPKYLSILNHLRFYLPEIFPKLNKVLFLDDDIVVKKDLTDLWKLDLKGNVIGAVETCGESFHRFNKYLNFSNPLISKNFNPHACGWAYGMNIFDLEEWKKQKITEVYHKWQKLNQDRQLWKLGTLPPGLITFWKRVFPLDRSWHVLGLGYNPNVNRKEIELAAVVHYNGNMKPWLEIGLPKYRNYWARYVNYDQAFLRDCNINP